MGRRKRPDSMVMEELKQDNIYIHRFLLNKFEKLINKPNVDFNYKVKDMILTINNHTNSFSGLMKTIHLAEDVAELERIVNSIPPEQLAKIIQTPESINPDVILPDPLA